MENQANKTSLKWAKYYENHKKVWFDPVIHPFIKSILRLVELHRSDSQGWSLSIRKIAQLLNISQNTVIKYTNEALKLGFLESTNNQQRKRRKLRLSASLRSPLEYSKSSEPTLTQWIRQSALTTDTPTASSVESVNSKEILKLNSNQSKSEELTSNKETEGYKKFIKTGKELFRRRKI